MHMHASGRKKGYADSGIPCAPEGAAISSASNGAEHPLLDQVASRREVNAGTP